MFGPPATLTRMPFPWQGSLLDRGPGRPDTTFAGLTRQRLAKGAWVDHQAGWFGGSDDLFARLMGELDWQGHTALIYDRLVPEPRLTAQMSAAELADCPALTAAAEALTDRYGPRLESSWLNLYRDGSDSVAWHGDRVAREQPTALVAIVSLGDRRRFRLRPAGGGPSVRFDLGRGDLLVMGGTCQRTWEHCVPKVARAAPRISVTFRPGRSPAPNRWVIPEES